MRALCCRWWCARHSSSSTSIGLSLIAAGDKRTTVNVNTMLCSVFERVYMTREGGGGNQRGQMNPKNIQGWFFLLTVERRTKTEFCLAGWNEKNLDDKSTTADSSLCKHSLCRLIKKGRKRHITRGRENRCNNSETDRKHDRTDLAALSVIFRALVCCSKRCHLVSFSFA